MSVGALDRLGAAQRVIVVISLALVLLAVGIYVSTLGLQGGDIAGGIEKATFLNPSQGFTPPMVVGQVVPDLSAWQQLLVWLGLILVWTTLSVVVMRPPRHGDVETDTVR